MRKNVGGGRKGAAEREAGLRHIFVKGLCRDFAMLTDAQQAKVCDLLNAMQKPDEHSENFAREKEIGQLAGRLKTPLLRHLSGVVSNTSWANLVIFLFVTQPVADILQQQEFIQQLSQKFRGPALIREVALRVYESYLTARILAGEEKARQVQNGTAIMPGA